MCRLKLRLPDGSSSIAKFPVTAPLSEVHDHVAAHVPRPFTQFKLASSVLQRPFTQEDMGRTLTQLQLVPSAIVVIMPVRTPATERLIIFSRHYKLLVYLPVKITGSKLQISLYFVC